MKKSLKKAASKTVPAKKAEPVQSKYTNTPNEKDTYRRMPINIYGPTNAGKTWLALGLSDFWPDNIEKRSAKSPWLELRDTIHISWDPEGTAGLLPYRIRAQYNFNIPDLISQIGFQSVLLTVAEEVKRIIDEDPEVRLVIHDHISAADIASLAYYSHPNNIPKSRKTGDEDTQAMWGLHQRFHLRYSTEFMFDIPAEVQQVFLFQQRIMNEESYRDSAEQKARNDQQKLGAVGSNVRLDTNGMGWKFYTNSAVLELPLIATYDKNKKSFRRVLYTHPMGGYRVKNKFQAFTDPVEPADLKKLLAKIEAHK